LNNFKTIHESWIWVQKCGVIMKKLLLFSILLSLIPIIFAVSCKNAVRGLEYSDVSTFDWLQANVKNKEGNNVLWFQVFDQVGDAKTIEGYKNSSERIGKYPARIFDNKWIWLMVNNRIEIRCIADNKSKEFQSNEKLKEFILAFDLEGMGRVTGPKLKGTDLKKFIPRLGE
jgi:hypothetical protein